MSATVLYAVFSGPLRRAYLAGKTSSLFDAQALAVSELSPGGIVALRVLPPGCTPRGSVFQWENLPGEVLDDPVKAFLHLGGSLKTEKGVVEMVREIRDEWDEKEGEE